MRPLQNVDFSSPTWDGTQAPALESTALSTGPQRKSLSHGSEGQKSLSAQLDALQSQDQGVSLAGLTCRLWGEPSSRLIQVKLAEPGFLSVCD